MSRFMFSTGIENSSPTIANGRKRIDEMAACKHYDFWRDDFALVQEDLRVRTLRYGVPLYKTFLGPDRFDWEFTDLAFGDLKTRKIIPIADLCHFGVPDWIGDFQNRDFPELFAAYARAFAERFPWVQLYTPVNEMYVCATYSAAYGWWNEQLSSDKGFVTALKHIVKANILAMHEILSVRPDAIFVQSESSVYRAGPGYLDSSPRILSGSLPGFAERGAFRFCRGAREGVDAMGRAVSELGILADEQIREEPSMSKSFNPRMPMTAYDHTITIVAVLELSGKSWLLGAVAPGVDRRTKRSIDARDIEGVLKALARLKIEARKAGFEVGRVVLGYEAGRDGFWIARALQARGLEVYVMHPSSISVERRGRRAKSDRLDVDILLGTLLGWLRGEPRRCTMAPIPTEAEEDMREPGRRREAIVAARLKVENQIDALLVRYGVESFKPRLKNAEQKLAELKTADGRELPPNTMSSDC